MATTTNSRDTINPDEESGQVLEKKKTSATEQDAYSIYNHRQKVVIVVVASVSALISPMTQAIYLPALNSMAASLHVSNSLINLTLTSFLIFQGLAPSFIGSYSDSAGRRPAYIVCLIIYLGANVGIALQRDYAALLVLRCMQSTGSSSLIALGNAIVADVSPPSERGTYISYASMGSVVGPSIGPVIGGLLSNYLGWPSIFWFLTIFGAAIMIPFLLFFPETGRAIVGNGSIPPPAMNHTILSYLYERRLKKEGCYDFFAERDRLKASRKTAWPNPWETISIIFTKTAGLALLGNGVLFSCYYSIIGSLPSQFRKTYGYSDLHISLLYLPLGVGSLLSALTTGKLIDANFRRHARKLGLPPIARNKNNVNLLTFPLERARVELAIPCTLIGASGMLIYGWLVDRRLSVAGPCVCLFAIGYAVSAGFNCLNLLLIDMYPGKPASATAANNLVRCWLGAGAAAIIVPLINATSYGVAVTIVAAIWVSFTPVLLGLIRWGPRWRKADAEKMAKKQQEKRNQLQGVETESVLVQRLSNAHHAGARQDSDTASLTAKELQSDSTFDIRKA